MDASPWTYAIASVEMRREGKVADDAPPGINKIPDPRRFVYVEACGHGRQRRARRLSIGTVQSASQSAEPIWTSSDRGLPQYRIVRDGCFTHRDAAASRNRALRHPRRPRARVRAAAGCRNAERPPPNPVAADTDQQGVHARRALPARRVDSELGRAGRRFARAVTRWRSRSGECERSGARARDARHPQDFPRRGRARRRGPHGRSRRRAHAARRERRRQVDADEDSERGLSQGRRRDSSQRPACGDCQPARCARSRHPRHLPGAQPRSAPVGRREHFSRRAADALGRHRRLAHAARTHVGAAARPRHDARSARAGRTPGPRAEADGRDCQGARAGLRQGFGGPGRRRGDPRHGRADVRAHQPRGDAALRAHRAPDRARRLHHLHHASSRRGVPHRPAYHRHARRPSRDDKAGRAGERARARSPDGEPRS